MSVYYRKVPNFEVPETKTKKGLDIQVTLHLENIWIITSFFNLAWFPLDLVGFSNIEWIDDDITQC